MPILLQGLRQRFDSQLALDGVDLHVRRGDRYGFIGHNGAGKTTALRIALGLLRPTAGRVWIDGHDPARSPRIRALVGGLIERPGFHDSRTARQNLDMLAAVQGIERSQRTAEVDRVLGLLDLSAAAEKRVGHYSQGMRQRLGLAQALLGSPRYLLLDEPTNGLDPEGIFDLRRLLLELSREQGITILLSSHLLQEVAGLCNRIGVLQRGKMLVEATTKELLATEAKSYRLATDDDTAAAELLAAKGVTASLSPDGSLRLDLDEEDPAKVVESLVHAERRVLRFTPVENSLEEIYLAHARGERRAGPRTPEAPKSPTSELPTLRHAYAKICAYELRRLARPGTIFALLSPALVAPAVIYQRQAAAQHDAAEVAGRSLISATDVTAFEALGRALQTALPLLVLVLAGIASQSLAGQLRNGTLRNLLIRPFHRYEIALGKLAALFVVSCLAYLCLLASAALAAGIAFHYGDLVEILSTGGGTFPILSASEVWPELWPTLASPVLPLLAFTTIGYLVSSLTRSSASALSLSLGTVIALDLGRALARVFDFEALLPGPYLPSPLARNSHLDFFVEFASGVSNPADYFAPTALWVPAIWMGTCSALAVWTLRRKYLP